MTGLNHLARCPVVPRRVLVEQDAEVTQRPCQPLAGVRGTDRSLVEYGVTQVDALVVVQKEDRADIACAKRAESKWAGAPDAAACTAGVERVTDPFVRLGLLGGLDRTSLQLFHGDWDAFDGYEGHEGLLSDHFAVRSTARIDDLEGLDVREGLGELCGGSGLDELHGLAWIANGWFLFPQCSVSIFFAEVLLSKKGNPFLRRLRFIDQFRGIV